MGAPRAHLPVVAILVGWLLTGLAAGTFATETRPQDKLRQKQQELERLKSQAQAIEARLERTRAHKKGVRSALYELEEQIGALRERQQKNRQTLKQIRRRLNTLKKRRERIANRLNDHRSQLAAYLEAAYRGGQQGFLRQLFGHENPAALRRALAYLSYLHRAQQRRIAQLRTDRARLQKVLDQLKERREQAHQLEERLAEQEAQLEARKAQRQDLLEKLADKSRHQKQRLSALRSDQASLRRLLGQLRQEGLGQLKGQRMSDLQGELPLPVAEGKILTHFGTAREGQSLKWQGVLLGAEPGTEVRAVFRGRVAYADHLRGYGLLVIVDHGQGLLSLYGHNRALFKEVGEWVETGALLAEVGSTGRQQRSATYFEIRREGQPVDPLKWCRSPRGQKRSRAKPPLPSRHLWALR